MLLNIQACEVNGFESNIMNSIRFERKLILLIESGFSHVDSDWVFPFALNIMFYKKIGIFLISGGVIT